MQTVGNRLLVTGGSDAQPLTSDTLAQMAPDRVSRQMRGGYVTTVVDEDVQIGGDMPTRFLLSESQELVAADGHHITLHPGAVSGVTTSGRTVDGLMLSGKKVRDEYPSHWLNSPQWQRFRAEAMNRGEVVFEGIRRLRVRCGSTTVNNDRPIFLQHPGFGGGAFFAREAFVEAQLADDYLLLDDGIAVDSYTAEFYKKRPFIGVRPDRIRPGEVFDLTITVCDPDSFDNLLIPREDELRTPDVRVKVNDVDITPALADKFAGFNPFGFPSNATSPYPGFRLVWPQMKIDEEMPLKIEVQVRDALGNVNQVVQRHSITRLQGLVDFYSFPRGLYGVPRSRLSIVESHGFNLVLNDNYTGACAAGCHKHPLIAELDPMLGPWLDKAKQLGLKTLASWFGLGEMACLACPWEERILRCFDPGLSYPADPTKIDIVQVVDEPRPINTTRGDDWSAYGCWYEERDQVPPGTQPRFPCWDIESADLDAANYLTLYNYEKWTIRGIECPQIFFKEYHRVLDICRFLNQTWLAQRQGFRPLFINLFAQGNPGDGWGFRREEIWAKFMKYCHYFSIDYYPVKWGTALTRVAWFLDEMHQAREQMWAAGNTPEEPWVLDWASCGLPVLWFVLDFGDWWGWTPKRDWEPGYPGYWANEIKDRSRRRCPTEEEYKAMTYLAVVHGAKGLLYYRYPWNDCSEYSPYRPPTRVPPSEPPTDPDTGNQVCFYDSPNCRRQWRVAWETNRELEILSPVIFTERCLERSIPDEVEVIEHEFAVPAQNPDHLIPLTENSPSSLLQEKSIPASANIPQLSAPAAAPHPTPTPCAASTHTVDGDPYPWAIHFPGRTKSSNRGGKMILKDIGDDFYYLIAVNGRSYALSVEFIFNSPAPWLHKEGGIPISEIHPYYVGVMFEHPPNDTILVRFPSENQFSFVCDFSGYQRRVLKIRKAHFPSARVEPFLQVPAPLIERLMS